MITAKIRKIAEWGSCVKKPPTTESSQWNFFLNEEWTVNT